jgi:hypothetical protein
MSELIQAYNASVSPIFDLPVLVTRSGNRYSIVGRDVEKYNDWGTSPYLPKHGSQHSFAPELGFGGDVTWIYSKQFVPLSSIPSGTAGAGSVIINSYVYRDSADGSWRYLGDVGSPNPLALKPTGTSARMLLLVWDVDQQNPAFITGSFFSSSLTGTPSIVPYIPSITNNRQIPISAIRLVSGTSVIGWDNIYDVRQFAVNTPAPFVGGVIIKDEGTVVGTGTTLNFVGDGVSVSFGGDTATITISGSVSGGGSSIDTLGFAGQDEGVNLGTGTVLNVVGDGASLSRSGTVFRLNVPSAAINTGTLDARYLKLDSTNDPVTGNLLITGAVTVQGTITLERPGLSALSVEGNYFQLASGVSTSFEVDNYNVGIAGAFYQFPIGDVAMNQPLVDLWRGTDEYYAPNISAPLIAAGTYDASGTTSGGLLVYTLNNIERVEINPSKTGTGTAVYFDTEAELSHHGKLLLLENAGTPKFWVNASGTAFERNTPLAKTSGVFATFTTVDGKTVTVRDGIITSVV